ncbi:MAG: nicotinate-nucleotide--dimethylbenzimidazole phosphoribosyltransferase [Lentisphaerae bacterium]|nr:nicotinate-nucleotide--dimethylbenzimidazole phosphoribosyltransferase [Lentisphaerota bacterium]
MKALLASTLSSIVPADPSIGSAIQAHLDDLTKPQGSLGRLEELAMRYCVARGEVRPRLGGKRIYCFAGDHGVAAEKVSAFPPAVTPQMVHNIVAGGAAVSVLSRHVGADLVVVDIGVDAEFAAAPGLRLVKVRRGTRNLAVGPALTREEATQALETGIGLAFEAAEAGVTMLGTGEMGIANTTPSTAMFAAYLGCDPATVVGRGTGVDAAGLAHKTDVVRRALAVNAGQLGDALGVLAALGGLEIAGISGLILGAAARRIPVVVDGFISCAGALAAMRLCPAAADYLFFAHLSQERGHRHVLEALKVRPILDLDMRLGEGTGAALAMSVLEGAMKVYGGMATFSSAGVSGRDAEDKG